MGRPSGTQLCLALVARRSLILVALTWMSPYVRGGGNPLCTPRVGAVEGAGSEYEVRRLALRSRVDYTRKGPTQLPG